MLTMRIGGSHAQRRMGCVATHTNSRGRGGDGTTTPTHCLFAGWEVAAQGLLLFGSIPCFFDK